MSSLKNILNPERKRSVKLLLIPPQQASSSWEPPSISHPSPGSSSEDDPGDYNPLIHIPHPDCPDSLACLPDTDGRPQHTLPVILRCAILGSPRKRLTIREIYAAMEEKYAYYRTAGATWKQSVRHHLSLNRLFERQPRPATDPGFGSYWTKDDAPEEPSSSKPRRGRPRKDDSPVPVTALAVADLTSPIMPLIEPPIEPLIEPPIEASGELDDEGDVNMLHYEDELIDELESHASERDDEFASPLPLASPHLASPQQPSPHRSSPQFSTDSANSEEIIEQLQMEMAHLRRQSAEAISVSIHLADQLAHAQEEASETRSALEVMESKLREETNKRRQAEREADDAVRLRRAAEEALKSMRFHSDLPRIAR
ncbi:hypothetical protein B0H13DRAFT_2052522 [Mycena leptocephala]|nr:hypothetical protein B0H13DRAFT_2052522 [Mycena leptocephala]